MDEALLEHMLHAQNADGIPFLVEEIRRLRAGLLQLSDVSRYSTNIRTFEVCFRAGPITESVDTTPSKFARNILEGR